MELTKLVRAIFKRELLEERQPGHSKVYYIKSMFNEDKCSFFGTFRYRISKEDVYLVRLYINFRNTTKNTQISITQVKPMKKFTKTIFKKSFGIFHKSLLEIIEGPVITELGETLTNAIQRFEEERKGK